MRSWRKTVSRLLALIFALVLVFLIAQAGLYTSQYIRLLRGENENRLNLWMNSCETRLDTVRDYVYEFLLEVYKKTDSSLGSGPIPVPVSVQLQDLMKNMLHVNEDADCFFLTEKESGKKLFFAKETLRNTRILQLKEYVFSMDEGPAASVSDRRWRICEIDGETYFLCLLRAGKYTAGALCRANRFAEVGEAGILEQGDSLMLAAGDGTVWPVVGEDRSDMIRFDDGKITIRETWNAIRRDDHPLLDCSVVMISASPFSFAGWWYIPAFMILGLAILLFLIIRVSWIILRRVVRPTRELLHAQEEIGAGNLAYRIGTKADSSEFAAQYNSFNDMADQIVRLEDKTRESMQKEEENRFRMVRAQVRPHFYLNSITVIHNMTYQNRLEDIRSYVQALAKHIRYMLNIQSQMIPVSEEMSQIENYLRMQELRFPGSVKASLRCEEETRGVEIPFLTLFTVAENSIKHAMNLYSPLELDIRCEPWQEEGFKGSRLVVEDNGDGFSAEALAHFSGASEGELPTKDHLGLSNVRYTLQAVYRRDGLLRLSNSGHGARTEILIPEEVNP